MKRVDGFMVDLVVRSLADSKTARRQDVARQLIESMPAATCDRPGIGVSALIDKAKIGWPSWVQTVSTDRPCLFALFVGM